jgi:hypothetical protein
MDAFKHDLMELKAELFDLAADGKIDFLHPSYRLLQNRIESMIQWAGRLTIIHFLVAWAAWPAYKSLVCHDWDEPEEDHSMREELVAIHHWLLLRAFFQALHIPAFMLHFGRVAWGLTYPASESKAQIAKAVRILNRFGLLNPVKILVLEAVDASELEAAVNAAKAAASRGANA